MTKWRKRFYQEGVDGLGDRKRPGRPRAFPAAVVAACKAIACELPATRGVPLGRRSLVELRDELLATGLSMTCRPRRCGAGWTRARSSRGSTAPGRPGRAPGTTVWPLRAVDRRPARRQADGAGDGKRAVCLASWLNQVEIYFSVVQRKALTPNDFGALAEVERRLLGFQRRYQQTAVPFDWRFTRADLARLLHRLDARAQRATAA